MMLNGKIKEFRWREMSRIVEYIKFLRKLNILEFFYLNYFCKNVIRTDKHKIIPYKNTVMDLEADSRIYVGGGDLEIGCDLIHKSKSETRIRLRKNAIWSSCGGGKISYGTTIELLKDAVFDTGYFTINSNSTLISAHRMCFGSDVMISRNVVIYDSDFHTITDEKGVAINKSEKVVVGDHVWIAANVIVLKGTNIGAGSIIGANTTISGNIPENCTCYTDFTRKIRKNKGIWKRKHPHHKNII